MNGGVVGKWSYILLFLHPPDIQNVVVLSHESQKKKWLYYNEYKISVWHGVTTGTIDTSQQQSALFNPQLGLVSQCSPVSSYLPKTCWKWVGYGNYFPWLGMCVWMCVCCCSTALHSTGFPTRVYSQLAPSVPWIGSRPTGTLIRIIKWMNEWMN